MKNKSFKGLVTDLYFIMEEELRKSLRGTEFEKVRPADGKIFMIISRQALSLTEYSKITGTSRQSVHKSINRLVDFGMIELVSAPNSKREKIPLITDKGKEAQALLKDILMKIEQQQIEKIGAVRFKEFKETLVDLTEL